MHCGCLTLETLYLNNIIHQSGIRIWWCFPLKKKHDFKWRRSDLTIVGTPHQVAGQQDLPWNIQLMPILFDDKHVDLPVYIYIYTYMWRGLFGFISFLRSYVHTRAFLHRYIYIYICGEDLLGLFRSYAHMSTRVLSCTRTYIYIYIYIYICGEDLLGLFRSYAHMSTRVLSCTRTYIYIYLWRGPFGFISFLRSYVHTRAFLHTYIYIYIYICSKNGHEPVRKLLNHPRVRVPSSRFENKLLIWFGNTKHLRVVGQKTWPSPWNHWGGPLQIPQNNGKSTSKLYKLGWITMFMGTWRV